jgi:hypothetical protein
MHIVKDIQTIQRECSEVPCLSGTFTGQTRTQFNGHQACADSDASTILQNLYYQIY